MVCSDSQIAIGTDNREQKAQSEHLVLLMVPLARESFVIPAY